MRHYILEDELPLLEPDLFVWAQWMEENMEERTVAQTQFGEHVVSTVFLGIDHSWDENSWPVLYETMVFGGDFDGEMWRYSDRESALAGHGEVVEKMQKAQSLIAEVEILLGEVEL